MGRQTYYLLLIQGKEFLKTSMILYLNVFTQLDDFMRGTGLGFLSAGCWLRNLEVLL